MQRAERIALVVIIAVMTLATPASADAPLTNVRDTVTSSDPGAADVAHAIAFRLSTVGSAQQHRLTIDLSSGPFLGLACAGVRFEGLDGAGRCSTSGHVLTYEWVGGRELEDELVGITIPGLRNPRPLSSTSYRIPVSYAANGLTVARASAVVNINPEIIVELTVPQSLVFLVTPATVADPRALLMVKTNLKEGFSVTMLAEVLPEGFGATIGGGESPYRWDPAAMRPSRLATWGSGQELARDVRLAQPYTVMTSSGATGNEGRSKLFDLRTVDWVVPGSLQGLVMTLVASPGY